MLTPIGRIKGYRGYTITCAEIGFLIQFPSGDLILIKDALTFRECQNWIDRQLALLAISRIDPEQN